MEIDKYFMTIEDGSYVATLKGLRRSNCYCAHDFLEIRLVRKDFPRLAFSCKAPVSTPLTAEFEEAKFIIGEQDQTVVLFITSKNDKTPIFRLPVDFIGQVIDQTRGDFDLMPLDFEASCVFDLNDRVSGVVDLRPPPAHTYLGTHSIFYSRDRYNPTILSAWATLTSITARLSPEKETTIASQFADEISKILQEGLKQYYHCLAVEQARANFVPSENDPPVFLFSEGSFSKAITGDGKVICDISGPKNHERANLEEMKTRIKENYWQYRIVIASKDDAETKDFMDRLIALPHNPEDEHLNDVVSFLTAVKEKYEGKEYTGGWVRLYAD